MTVTLRKWENITCNYIHYILSTFHCCLLQPTSYAHISNKLLETNPRIFSVTSSTRSRSQKLCYSCIKTLSPHFLWFSNLILTSISKSLCILMFGRNKDSQNPPTRESSFLYNAFNVTAYSLANHRSLLRFSDQGLEWEVPKLTYLLLAIFIVALSQF